jgi:hypothetical protein
VDPLAGKFPFYTPYQYAGNDPINFIDLDGKEKAQPDGGTSTANPTPPNQGSGGASVATSTTSSENATTENIEVHPNAYYNNDGTFLGYDSKNNNNEVYTADSATKNSDGSTTFENATKIKNITHEAFQKEAATVYGESSAYKMNTVTQDLKNEMYGIASVHQKNNIAYGANSPKAKEFLNLTPESRNNSSFKKAAVEALINAKTGGADKSNGAVMWDGKEQALYPASQDTFSIDGFELHMNTMGWSIDSTHYETWKTNVGSSFQAPQSKSAPGNYGNYKNSGKKRLESTAVYLQTIFWKVVD